MKKYKAIFILILSVALGNFNHTVYAQTNEPLKIMNYNVLVGFNGSNMYRDKYRNWITERLPDVITYQEMSKFTEESFAAFAKSYGHAYTAFFDTGSCCPLAISSKYPVSKIQKLKLEMNHGIIVAEIQGYTLVVLHLDPKSWEQRLVEIDKILKIIKPLSTKKLLMMGDFNSFSPVDAGIYNAQQARLDRAIKGKSKNINNGDFDYSVIQQVIEAGYIDTWWEKHQTFSHTCPTKLHSTSGDSDKLRIDYIWTSPDLKSKIKNCEIIYDSTTHMLSDHYPVLLTLER